MKIRSLTLSVTFLMALLLFSSTCTAQAKDEQAEPTIRIDTRLVNIPVTAMDRSGKFVPDLQPQNFSLYEDNIKQEIAFFHTADEPVTVALMLDVSDSTEKSLQEIREAALAFVEQLRPHDQVIVIEFDSGLRELALATTDRQVIRQAILATSTGGGTRLYDALDTVLTKRLNQSIRRKAIILFTDGVDIDSKITLEQSLRSVQEAGAFVYPIQYKQPINNTALRPTNSAAAPTSSYRGDPTKADYYLRTLANNTGTRFYMAEDKKSLTKSFALIAEELRKQYNLGYYPTAAAKPGQKVKIKITVDRPEVVIRTRNSYVQTAPSANR